MEKAITGSIDVLLGQGLLGIVVLGLCFVIWRQWKRYETLQESYNTLQEKRIAEGREGLMAVNANTNALANLTQVIGLLRQ